LGLGPGCGIGWVLGAPALPVVSCAPLLGVALAGSVCQSDSNPLYRSLDFARCSNCSFLVANSFTPNENSPGWLYDFCALAPGAGSVRDAR
jgi:hypothetical protein